MVMSWQMLARNGQVGGDVGQCWPSFGSRSAKCGPKIDHLLGKAGHVWAKTNFGRHGANTAQIWQDLVKLGGASSGLADQLSSTV